MANNGKRGFVGGLVHDGVSRAKTSAKTHGEHAAQRPADEGLNGSTAVSTEMVSC